MPKRSTHYLLPLQPLHLVIILICCINLLSLVIRFYCNCQLHHVIEIMKNINFIILWSFSSIGVG
ncbi:unnamed protein product [Paramecium pentaurelia]|uniref:Uncharacterized protein n=1 Tax=Paramecium pentaurelia TaxID=43138 RepID=A0A8S1U799_9CILI|nr:unnamed protein product [Paramecium pentaurelia]